MEFDKPLPATFEEFQSQFQQFLSERPRDGQDLPEIQRWVARWNAREHELPEAEKAFKAGSGTALMKAASLCFDFALPVPEWVSSGLVEAQKKVEAYEAKHWDDVLGSPHEKGVHLATKRKHARLRPQVHWAVLEEVGDNGRAIDESLFEDIGRRFGVGKTLAAQFYYEEQKAIDEF